MVRRKKFSVAALLATLLLVPQISEARWGSEGRHDVRETQYVRASDANSIRALGKVNVQRDLIGTLGGAFLPVLGDVIRGAARTGREQETMNTPNGVITTERDYVPPAPVFSVPPVAISAARKDGRRAGRAFRGISTDRIPSYVYGNMRNREYREGFYEEYL